MPVFMLGGIRAPQRNISYLVNGLILYGRICGCGAAAFAAGATRAISTAAIVIEVTGQYHMLLPVSIGVLAAYFVANRFAKPVYDCLVTANAFPQLPKVSYRLGRECAEVASQPANPNSVFCLSSTKTDFEDMLRRNPRTMLFPVVNFNMILLGGFMQTSNQPLRANRAASSESDRNREAGYDSERITSSYQRPHELNTSNCGQFAVQTCRTIVLLTQHPSLVSIDIFAQSVNALERCAYRRFIW